MGAFHYLLSTKSLGTMYSAQCTKRSLVVALRALAIPSRFHWQQHQECTECIEGRGHCTIKLHIHFHDSIWHDIENKNSMQMELVMFHRM